MYMPVDVDVDVGVDRQITPYPTVVAVAHNLAYQPISQSRSITGKILLASVHEV